MRLSMIQIFNKGDIVEYENKLYCVLGIDERRLRKHIEKIKYYRSMNLDIVLATQFRDCYVIIRKETMNECAWQVPVLTLAMIYNILFSINIVGHMDLTTYLAKSNLVIGRNISMLSNEEAKMVLVSYRKKVKERVIGTLEPIEFENIKNLTLYCLVYDNTYCLILMNSGLVCWYRTKDLDDFFFHAYMNMHSDSYANYSNWRLSEEEKERGKLYEIKK